MRTKRERKKKKRREKSQDRGSVREKYKQSTIEIYEKKASKFWGLQRPEKGKRSEREEEKKGNELDKSITL